MQQAFGTTPVVLSSMHLTQFCDYRVICIGHCPVLVEQQKLGTMMWLWSSMHCGCRTGCNGDTSVVVEQVQWALLTVVVLNQGTAEEQVNIVLASWQEAPKVKNIYGKLLKWIQVQIVADKDARQL